MNDYLAVALAACVDGGSFATTPRELISWYGAMRRGRWVVEEIREDLAEAGLQTFPDFEGSYIDEDIFIIETLSVEQAAGDDAVEPSASPPDVFQNALNTPDDIAALVRRDPTYRISKLASATQGITSVKPDASLAEAITTMMAQNYSQLPVMPNTRDVAGVISWRSIGMRLALNTRGKLPQDLTARDVMDDGHQIIQSNRSLFDAIPLVLAYEFVLVRGHDKQITGLITANDLSVQFRTISEPFLLLSEIENLLRDMLRDRFSVSDLAAVRDPADGGRAVDRVDDLTFGEYIRLLEKPERWLQFGVPVDRVKFCGYLEDARRVRNEVMHFDPDGIAEDDLASLRELTRFLKELEAIRTSGARES